MESVKCVTWIDAPVRHGLACLRRLFASCSVAGRPVLPRDVQLAVTSQKKTAAHRRPYLARFLSLWDLSRVSVVVMTASPQICVEGKVARIRQISEAKR